MSIMHHVSNDYLSDLSKCVRCGSCKASCPVFEEEPLESMGARGRLVLLKNFIDGTIHASKRLNHRIFSCILCGACSGSCPLGVDIPESICRGRALLKKTDKERKHLRRIVKLSSKWPDAAFKIARMGHILMPALARRGIIPFNPEFPDFPLRKTDQVFKVSKKRGRVAVFTGCSINYVFPQFGESLINVLRKLKYEVVLPKGEVCCGAPLRALGLEEEATEQAKKNLRVFNSLKVEAVLSLCPTCTLTVREDYPKMVGDGLEKACDISVFFNDKVEKTERIGKNAVYHDPCHLNYGLGVRNEPRELIRRAGIEIREPEEKGCCGFGGLFCFSFRSLSDKLLEKRTAKLTATGADMLVTSCPGCILQLSRTIMDRPVLHLIELIEDAVCFRSEKAAKETEAEPLLF